MPYAFTQSGVGDLPPSILENLIHPPGPAVVCASAYAVVVRAWAPARCGRLARL